MQWRIIYDCCMLHNFIRNEMPVDIMEEKIDNDRIWDNVDKT